MHGRTSQPPAAPVPGVEHAPSPGERTTSPGATGPTPATMPHGPLGGAVVLLAATEAVVARTRPDGRDEITRVRRASRRPDAAPFHVRDPPRAGRPRPDPHPGRRRGTDGIRTGVRGGLPPSGPDHRGRERPRRAPGGPAGAPARAPVAPRLRRRGSTDPPPLPSRTTRKSRSARGWWKTGWTAGARTGENAGPPGQRAAPVVRRGVPERQMATRPAGGRRTADQATGIAREGVIPAKVRAPRVRWLARERLDQLVPQLWQHRLTLVVAPAGSGKTTLLAAWAGLSDAPAAWYRAESVDGSDAALAAHLAAAFGAALPDLGRWLAHGRTGGRRAGHPAGAAPPARDRRPPRADRDARRGRPRALPRIRAAVAGSRRRDAGPAGIQPVPASRLRRAPGADRRRPPLPVVGGGASLPRLLRRGASPRRAGPPRPPHRGLGRRPAALPPRDAGQADRRAPAAPRRARPELAAHARVPRPQRGRGAARRAPRLPRRDVRPAPPDRARSAIACSTGRAAGRSSRSSSGAASSRSPSTTTAPTATTRSCGATSKGCSSRRSARPTARARARRAGELLEGDGAIAEAVAAYSRAEEWAAVDRLLDHHGERLAAGQGAWMDTLPPALLVQDPWLILATARRHRAEGRWAQAVDAYGRAEALLGAGEAGATCRRERRGRRCLARAAARPRAGLERRPALRRRPRSARASPGPRRRTRRQAWRPAWPRCSGGRVAEARRLLHRAADEESAGPVLGTAAALGAGVAGLLAGDSRAVVETERAVAAAERAGSRLARPRRPCGPLRRTVSRRGRVRQLGRDRGARGSGARRGPLGRGAGGARRGLVGSRGARGRARAPRGGSHALPGPGGREPGGMGPWPRGARHGARRCARVPRSGPAGPRRSARSTGVAVGAGRRACRPRRARRARRPTSSGRRPAASSRRPGSCCPGRHGPAARRSARPPCRRAREGRRPGPTPPAEVRLFGAFAMAVDGRAIDLAGLKPRPRALLRFLALNEGKPIHREVLQETFWPEADGEAGAKSLHVALSALRRELAPHAERGACELLVREGDAYRLTLPAGSRIDLAELEEAIVAARRARSNGSPQAAVGPYRAVLAAYGGELLPEDGPAEWAAGRRDRTRAEVVEAARGLAEPPAPPRPGGRRGGVHRRARGRPLPRPALAAPRRSPRARRRPGRGDERPLRLRAHARRARRGGRRPGLIHRQGAADGDAAPCRLPKNSTSVIATGALAVSER